MGVIPALIPQSLEHVFETAKRVKSFSREIQIDVVDGVFADPVSWPYGSGDMQGEPHNIRSLSEMFEIEFDLMVMNPDVETERFLVAKPKRVIVHMDSFPDVEALAETVHAAGGLLGIAAANDTPLELFLDSLQHADYAQCMGITPVGAQGRPFDERTIERVRAVRERFPSMEIAVDGSVNKETIPPLREAGVNRFVSGSAILSAENPAHAYASLCMLLED
jgi:ribulose-phosphate 3-epimerase